MSEKQKTIEVIDTDVFNNTHKVPLPNNRYTKRAFLTTDLGSFSDSSTFNSDALADLYDAIRLNINGTQFEVDGQLVDFLNTLKDSLNRKEQLELAFQVSYQNALTGEVKGSDYSTLRLELDTDKVSNLSDGTASAHNDDARIVVSGDLADVGSTRAAPKISKSREDIHEGEDGFTLTQNGVWQAIVFQEEDVDLSELKVEVNVPGKEIVVIDDPTEVIRERNVRNAGTTDLPSGYYFVDLTKSDKFDSNNINYVDVSVDAETAGKLSVWSYTVQPKN